MSTTRKATPVELADCPDDGGKWAIYCEHDNGTSILQDTNRRRLNGWRTETIVWCEYCQDDNGQHRYGASQ